jgi:catechol 2,3-dioxygenase-like lactoylglutathione lyase family enzyme
MAIRKLTPMLYTPDLEGTVDFYVQQLGFSCVAADESWSCMQCDGIELMMSLPNAHIPFDKPLFSGSFYFSVTNVDALWQRLKDKTRICYGIENFDYGMREFALYDNNGYLLQFGEEIINPAE